VAAECAAGVDDVVKVIDADDASGDVSSDHFACWQLDQRGAVGETALHLCMLYGKLPEFRAISVTLLKIFPRLAVDYYEGDEYYGKFFSPLVAAAAATATFRPVIHKVPVADVKSCFDLRW